MKRKPLFFFICALTIFSSFLVGNYSKSLPQGDLGQHEFVGSSEDPGPIAGPDEFSRYDQFSTGEFSGYNFSTYSLNIGLNPEEHGLNGSLWVNYYNDDPVPHSRIPFHLYLYGMYYETRPGNFSINQVILAEAPATLLDFNLNIGQELLWVNLTEILAPYTFTSFKIYFNATLPDGGIDRTSDYGTDAEQTRILKCTAFYPMPCVFDDEGWHTEPYLDMVDPFFFDMAFYNFSVYAPSDYKIAGSGGLVGKYDAGGITKWTFDSQSPVREITFSASKYFESESLLWNGVNISAYYLAQNAEYWIWATKIAQNALEFYSDIYGIYPYSVLNIVEEFTQFGGMEYPQQVYISHDIAEKVYTGVYWDRYLINVISHEVSHQFWYNLVGNDEINEGFLDEGITYWTVNYLGEKAYGSFNYFYSTPFVNIVRNYDQTDLPDHLPRPINMSMEEALDRNIDKLMVDHRKSEPMFEKLRILLGTETFLASLQYLFKSQYFSFMTLNIVISAFEHVSGQQLDWFFLPWFNNDYIPHYSYDTLEFNRETRVLTIIIEDVNEPLNDYPYSQLVPLKVLDNLGNQMIEENVWINGTTEIIYTLEDSGKDPADVVLYMSDELYVIAESGSITMLRIPKMTYVGGRTISGFVVSLAIIISVITVSVFSSKIRKQDLNGYME